MASAGCRSSGANGSITSLDRPDPWSSGRSLLLSPAVSKRTLIADVRPGAVPSFSWTRGWRRNERLSALTSRVRVLACWQWAFVDRLRQVMRVSTREVSSAEMRASRKAPARETPSSSRSTSIA